MGPLRMGLFAVRTADCRDLAPRRDAAREGRAAAMQRRRQLSQGKQALSGAGTPAFIVLPGGAR